jgi:putative phosphoesterase
LPGGKVCFDWMEVPLHEIQEARIHRIGVISDTHGILRPAVLDAVRDTELIFHAGDVGGKEILLALEGIAPVVAVRGNMDRGVWTESLPVTQFVEVDEVAIYMLHDLQKLEIDPKAAGIAMVVSGHTHQPKIVERDSVLYLNPGSAGPRRSSKPVSVARLEVEGKRIDAEIILLED